MTPASEIALDDRDRDLLAGGQGPGMRLAMELVLQAAAILGAKRLIPIGFAHIDACFYAGEAHVDFAQYLLDHGAKLAVPAWTNNGLVSLADASLRPEAESPQMVRGAKRLMGLYAALGCRPVWTCAPYQLPGGPKLGDHIAAGESNAVCYYNAVVGARTNKYGDFLDMACALVGKAPFAGLHTDAGRRATIAFDCSGLPDALRREDIVFHLIGHHVGRIAGRRVPAIMGLPQTSSRDNLKAASAALAASGGVEHWHGVAVTPEAPDLAAALGRQEPSEISTITDRDLSAAQGELTSGRDGRLDMVALGTPHFSPSEFGRLAELLDGRRIASGLKMIVSTSRFVQAVAAEAGTFEAIERAGIEIVVDTCTYMSPAVRGMHGRVMTNAAKWAYYAPGMLGVEVCFGSLRECVESAVAGEVRRDPALWARLA